MKKLLALATLLGATEGVKAQTYLDLDQRIELNNRTDVEVEVRPRINVDVNVPPPDFGPWGQGSWVKAATLSYKGSYNCYKKKICGTVIMVDTNSIRRRKNVADFKANIGEIGVDGRTRPISYGYPGSGWRVNCKNKQYWVNKTANWVPTTGNPVLTSVVQFVCEE